MAPNRYFTSDAVPTTLAASLPTATPGAAGNVQVASITGYPVSYPFTLLLDWGTAVQEVVTVTQAATGGGPYTYGNCVRGDDGSTPAGAPAHATGATAVHGVSARDYAEPQTHLGASTGVHGVTGALAPLTSPALTGTPTAPTPPGSTDNTTSIATTAFVQAVASAIQSFNTGVYAPLISPALTGTPTAPTAAALTSSTRVATTAYTDNAVAAGGAVLTQAAIATASCTAAANQVVPVNTTSGNVTVTLPAAPKTGTLVAVKQVIQGGTNTVTVACGGSDVLNKAGGGTSLTLSLASQGVLLAYSGGIWVNLADDLPLTQLDGRYARVFSPLAYGAAGNGATDDTTAVQAAFAAATTAAGMVDLGTSVFLISSPVSITGAVSVKGSGSGAIRSSTSDVFTVTGGSTVTFDNVILWSLTGGGHVFNASSGPALSMWTFTRCYLRNDNAAKAIWYQNGGGLIDALFGDDCNLWASGSATVSPMSFLRMPGAFNSVQFKRMRCTFNGSSATVPFFTIDPGYGTHTDLITTTVSSTTVADTSAVAADIGSAAGPNFVYNAAFPGGGSKITAVTPGTGYTVLTAATTAVTNSSATIGTRGWNEDIEFDSITWELCRSGAIAATACVDISIRMCAYWDIAPVSNVYSFTQSLTGYPCRNIIVKGGRSSSATGSIYDIYADATCTNIMVESFGAWGTAPNISATANQLTLVNLTTASGTSPLQAPILIASGLTGATAASRHVGATLAGAPAGSTAFLVGDFVVDQTGSIWICTVAGTPGTWAQVGSASGYASATDPMRIGFNANYTTTNAGAGNSAFSSGGGANSATYIRLTSAGYSSSNLIFSVGASSGNISVCYYTASGSGAANKPTGGQPATSGAVACPAIGIATVALGGSCIPSLADWVAMSCDNTTATFVVNNSGGSNTALSNGLTWYQTSAHPLPATPVPATAAYQHVLMKGS